MATDNTSDISENDIIVAFELKNNSNPLAIYLEYQSKFLFLYDMNHTVSDSYQIVTFNPYPRFLGQLPSVFSGKKSRIIAGDVTVGT